MGCSFTSLPNLIESINMKTLLGFYIYLRHSSIMGGEYAVYYVDNGFGELVASPCPVHAINTSNS
jgi:hypothetical protein